MKKNGIKSFTQILDIAYKGNQVIGIVVDNYKVKKFTKALRKKEIEFKKLFLTTNITLITFQIDADRVNEISIMCKQLEIEIKLSN